MGAEGGGFPSYLAYLAIVSTQRNEMMGAPKEHCGVEKCYRATTRESVNDCFPTCAETAEICGKKRGIAEESDEKRQTAR